MVIISFIPMKLGFIALHFFFHSVNVKEMQKCSMLHRKPTLLILIKILSYPRHNNLLQSTTPVSDDCIRSICILASVDILNACIPRV